jgi:hypothetical protein
MFRTAWRVLVVGAFAAAGLALPGTANASTTSACTLAAGGAYVPATDLAVVTGTGAFECLVSALDLVIGDLPDPNAPDQYIDVTVMYQTSAAGAWQVCGNEWHSALVEGVGAGAVVSLCPFDTGYNYKVHARARVVYAVDPDSGSSTTIPVGPPNGCVHDAATFSITCYADSILVG